MKLVRILCLGSFQQRRHEIDDMSDLLRQCAAGRDAGRPVCHKRRRDAPFVRPHLMFAKWRVRRVGPTDLQAAMRTALADDRAGAMSARGSASYQVRSALAPLSDRNMTSVLSVAPSFSTAASTRPMP